MPLENCTTNEEPIDAMFLIHQMNVCIEGSGFTSCLMWAKTIALLRDSNLKKKGRVETLPCSDPTKQSHEIPARHSVFSPG